MVAKKKVDKMDMDTLDAVLEEFPVKNKKVESSTVRRNIVFIVCSLCMTSSPVYLFTTPKFGLNVGEHFWLFVLVSFFSTPLLVNSLKSASLKHEKKLVHDRTQMLKTVRQTSRGKKRQQQIDLEERLEASLAGTSALEGASYALWFNNLMFLCFFMFLSWLTMPGETVPDDDTYKRRSAFSYAISILLPSIALSVIS